MAALVTAPGGGGGGGGCSRGAAVCTLLGFNPVSSARADPCPREIRQSGQAPILIALQQERHNVPCTASAYDTPGINIYMLEVLRGPKPKAEEIPRLQ